MFLKQRLDRRIEQCVLPNITGQAKEGVKADPNIAIFPSMEPFFFIFKSFSDVFFYFKTEQCSLFSSSTPLPYLKKRKEGGKEQGENTNV